MEQTLSNAQKDAIQHKDGPAMVLAGPGSGKTLVITNRVRYLTEKCGVSPASILVITFTRAAAGQMRERYEKLCNRRGVTFGTFHSVFFMILRAAYHYTPQNIIREDRRMNLLEELARREKLPMEEEGALSDLAAEISLVKNEQIPLDHYYAACAPSDVFRSLFRNYQQRLQSEGFLDFDDMLVYTRQLLTERPDILKGWQNRFRYILIDEFQDINLLQYEIVRLLAGKERNLFIVGDDDQSIYRFRGAKPEIMLQFPKHYPDAKKILLDINFRSTPEIVAFAGKVISENENRFPKKIRAVRASGEEPEVLMLGTPVQEAVYVADYIQKAMREGTSLNSFAVLFRTNQAMSLYAEKLLEFNLPFRMRDKLPNIYDHWIARDIFAYFSLALDGLSREAFLRIMNRPLRYLPRDLVRLEKLDYDQMRAFFRDKDWMQDRISSLQTDLRVISRIRPFAAVNYIRQAVGYDSYLEEYAKERKLPLQDLTDLADELQQSAAPYATYKEWMDHITEYTEKLEEHLQEQIPDEAITLSTLHASKGLEFDEVFLTDINEDIIPHRKSVLAADIEEERRLLYVGITRARDRLHILYARERYGKSMEPSSFLPEEAVEDEP